MFKISVFLPKKKKTSPKLGKDASENPDVLSRNRKKRFPKLKKSKENPNTKSWLLLIFQKLKISKIFTISNVIYYTKSVTDLQGRF